MMPVIVSCQGWVRIPAVEVKQDDGVARIRRFALAHRVLRVHREAVALGSHLGYTARLYATMTSHMDELLEAAGALLPVEPGGAAE